MNERQVSVVLKVLKVNKGKLFARFKRKSIKSLQVVLELALRVRVCVCMCLCEYVCVCVRLRVFE